MKIPFVIFGVAAASIFAQEILEQDSPKEESPAPVPKKIEYVAGNNDNVVQPNGNSDANYGDYDKMVWSTSVANGLSSGDNGSSGNGIALDLSNNGVGGPQLKIILSGSAEFDIYTSDLLDGLDFNEHYYYSSVNLNIEARLSDKWSGFLNLEARGSNDDYPSPYYRGIYVQYKPSENFAVKIGDLTLSEGAFKTYYEYDEPEYYATGIKERDIRGIELDLAGLQLAIGYGRGDNDSHNDRDVQGSNAGKDYDVHVAYDLNVADQHIRPFAYFKNPDEIKELHAGIDLGLHLGLFSLRAVYAFHTTADDHYSRSNVSFGYYDEDYEYYDADYRYYYRNNEDDGYDAVHTFLLETVLDAGVFQLQTAAFYALIGNDNVRTLADILEIFFLYAEPALRFADYIKLGIPVEYHSNTMDDIDSFSTLDFGLRLYITPIKSLEFTAFGMANYPLGKKLDDEDMGLRLGLETVFNF